MLVSDRDLHAWDTFRAHWFFKTFTVHHRPNKPFLSFLSFCTSAAESNNQSPPVFFLIGHNATLSWRFFDAHGHFALGSRCMCVCVSMMMGCCCIIVVDGWGRRLWVFRRFWVSVIRFLITKTVLFSCTTKNPFKTPLSHKPKLFTSTSAWHRHTLSFGGRRLFFFLMFFVFIIRYLTFARLCVVFERDNLFLEAKRRW